MPNSFLESISRRKAATDLQSIVDAVRELHSPLPLGSLVVCSACADDGLEPYPCQTIKLLDGESID